MGYQLLKRDDVTGEYFYRGKWYESYPWAEIEQDQNEWELSREERE